MSAGTSIEWADHTFNPWEGCQKVGPGCDNCYAETRNARFGGGLAVNWGAGAPRRRTSAGNWNLPVRWNAQADAFAAQHGRRQRVFCASLADVFDNAVPVEWRVDLFKLIAATPNLDWLLLTKRIGNVASMLGDYKTLPLLPNIWLGATIVNQAEAERDIPKLLAVPARVRFLSMEPLLGPVSFDGLFANPRDSRDGTNVLEALDWVIVGGESGPSARPMHPDWARELRDQCAMVHTPFLFKQWGEWAPTWTEAHAHMGFEAPPDPAGHMAIAGTVQIVDRYTDGTVKEALYPVIKAGKKAAGRLLDGRTHDGFPAP